MRSTRIKKNGRSDRVLRQRRPCCPWRGDRTVCGNGQCGWLRGGGRPEHLHSDSGNVCQASGPLSVAYAYGTGNIVQANGFNNHASAYGNDNRVVAGGGSGSINRRQPAATTTPPLSTATTT